jgi:hypothetical protein
MKKKRFYLIPVRIATIKKNTTNKDVGKKNPHTLLMGM